jgi:phosphatidylglycerol:prolipoprotein diacylglycerol transferase
MYPIVLKLGNTAITSYGLAACLGFLLAFFLASRRADKMGWDPEIPIDCYLIGTILGIVLARLLYVATYPKTFLADPLQILMIWRGGITYYGSLVGAALGTWGYCRYYRLPLGEVTDLFVPYLALAHTFGRIGCFLNGCCYGVATSVSWGVVFPQDRFQLHRHPTQLYESGLEFFNFLLLDQLWRRGYRGGRVTLVWFGIYAIERFFLEFLRGDTLTESFLFGTSLAQTMALAIAVLALGMAVWSKPYSEDELAQLVTLEDAEAGK